MKSLRLFLMPIIPLLACGNLFAAAVEHGTLPKNIKWETNDTDPVYASPEAKKGGTLRTYILSFPMTLRTVGPDSNGSFRSSLLGNQTQLTYVHPNTGNIIPGLATHWAYGKDSKTLYMKLNPKARWSDGKPVTSEDVSFALEFYRSKFITAPWYNTYYGEKYEKVVIYDKHTFAIVGKEKKMPKDLHYYVALSPRPKHFHKLDKNWVKDTNWKKEPNTGPYAIDKIVKGKHITFKRKKDWWGKDLRFFKNRFNPDRIKFVVIRDTNIAWEHFKKGRLDGFSLVLPEFWHKKSKNKLFNNGYIQKLWFYHDRPQPVYGIWLNQDVEIFKDLNVRKAFAHALNVDKVLKKVLRGDYQRLNTNTMGHGIYDNTEIKARPYDLKKADMYLKKAGWGKRGPDGIRVKNGKRFSVRITYGMKNHNDRLVVLKEDAKKAGIELTLQLLDSAASFKTLQEKRHEVAYTAWGAMDRPQYWGQYHSKNAHKAQTNNFSNTDDPKLDKLIEAYRGSFRLKKKAILAKKIQQNLHDNVYMIPLYAAPYIRIGYWRWVRFPEVPLTKTSRNPVFGYPFHGDNTDYGGLFWIDTKLKAETKKAKRKGRKFPVVNRTDTTFKPK